MNFLLFRGTFFNYSQLSNTVEGSCKSLGQTPCPVQIQILCPYETQRKTEARRTE